MSDYDMEKATNNLVTTEDTFEQFQACSVNEDNEFITLSDILPTENPSTDADVPGMLDDMYAETEQTSPNYTTLGATDYSAIEDKSLNTDLLSPPYGDAPDNSFKQPADTEALSSKKKSPVKKRGRRSKTVKTDNVSSIVEGKYNVEGVNTESNLNKQDTALTTVVSKRGRRIKKPLNYQSLLSRQDLPSNVSSSNVEKESDDSIIIGRKKTKRKSVTPLSEVNTSNGIERSKQLSLTKTGQVPKKRGRKKKIEVEENQEKVTELSQVDFEEEIPNSSLITKYDDDDDDDADISLSQLKKKDTSIHTNGTISSSENIKTTDTKKPILSEFEYNINNVIAETPNVLVESVFDIEPQMKVQSTLEDNLAEHQKECEQETLVEETSQDMEIEETLQDTVLDDINFNIEDVKSLKTNESCQDNGNSSLLVEDGNKRPQRRKVKRTHYEIDSDEDPFANVELSDDDGSPIKGKKGNAYYSDDDYNPDNNSNHKASTDESAYEEIDDDFMLSKKKKKGCKKSDIASPNKSPGKKGRPRKSSTLVGGSSNASISSSVSKNNDECIVLSDSKPLTHNNEFESFLAQRMKGTSLKIKKVSTTKSSDNNLAPLEIPTIDTKDVKKYVEKSSQTKAVTTKSASVQTSSKYGIKMTENVELSSEQSENACEFLKNLLKTTSELGTLMTEKSEEFMEKKINTTYVKDTTRIDYCIKKAFLLFKLAKDNLSTMEENLEKQYEDFLQKNNLSSAIETEKKITAKVPETNSDSDCEIVDVQEKTAAKPKFNPKTVFLNKELSIKIAKKTQPVNTSSASSSKKQVNVKGRHAVWINNSIMVKKVKSSQSFLAQDSRNKKPPDMSKYVTEEMVKHFFDDYYRKQAMVVCEPYTTPQWLCFDKKNEVTCNYFIINKNDESSSNCAVDERNYISTENNTEEFLVKESSINTNVDHKIVQKNPKKLVLLCSDFLQQHLIISSSKPAANKIESLLNLSIKQISSCLQSHSTGTTIAESNNNSFIQHDTIIQAKPLKQLCFMKVKELLHDKPQNTLNEYEYTDEATELQIDTTLSETLSVLVETAEKLPKINSISLKSLMTLCIEFIQSEIVLKKASKDINGVCIKHVWHSPNTLLTIAFNKTKCLVFGDTFHNINLNNNLEDIPLEKKLYNSKSLCQLSLDSLETYFNANNKTDNISLNTMTIDNINTLTEEAFLNMEEIENDAVQASYTDDEDDFDNDFDSRDHEEPLEENNWVSQLEMNELKSCFMAHLNNDTANENTLNPIEELNTIQIKQEIVEDNTELNDMLGKIKNEPTDIPSEMVNIPEDIRSELVNMNTKRELDYMENATPAEPTEVDKIRDYDVDHFESFVRNHKMMHADGLCSNEEDQIFSQSGLRVRRQHQPDSDVENDDFNDSDMGLLVPTLSEPLTVASAKGTLMESSSEDSESIEKTNKKQERKKKGRAKKSTGNKIAVEKEKQSKSKANNNNIDEISILTRRMREKIKNKEKSNESSESEIEELNLTKLKKTKELSKETSTADKTKPTLGKKQKKVDDEIQCNNVDSTEKIDDFVKSQPKNDLESINFSGFSTDEQVEIDKYRNILSNIYNKILPKSPSSAKSQVDDSPDTIASPERSNSPLMMMNEPAELLECEPTLPEYFDEKSPKKVKTKSQDKTTKKNIKTPEDTKENEGENSKFTERHGWKCYPIESKDKKIYQMAYVALQKLPEVFVETYFQYQHINDNEEDAEVNRLTNLNSLHRLPNAREVKNQVKPKERPEGQKGQRSEGGSGAASPLLSDNCNEFAPSDDDNAQFDEDMPLSAHKRSSENCLAKNLLMNDNDSGTDTATEQETGTEETRGKNKRSSAKVEKRVKVFADPESLVLTADKMMKKELEMLHAPIHLDEEAQEVQESKYTVPKESSSKHKDKSSSRHYSKRDRAKSDDSSSEEEKQWVSTKEKLLKRMEKRIQDDNIHEDAKRAKIVSEYIEKRVDSNPASNRKRGRKIKRKMTKKFLEREKQMRFLNNELYGDQGTHALTKRSGTYATGRRNIRKVIDKKSLARSTVIANMEEFERKRRLHVKQNRLRELLGYEEGVNVLVINDEVCLEYDFEELQPVVTVHPFFTKVMKAHQYEGVKFMWDACFESLEMTESGHPGGGCILAHCMGLGKTLQVLALLHTVLTHPRVGMQRVLVCCPLSTVLNWVDEIHKWLGPVTDQIKVFELSKLKKIYERAYQLEDWYKNGGIFIIGYELFRSLTTLDAQLDGIRPTIVNKIRSALLDPGPDIIVCDEGHLLKNDASVLAIAMSRVRTKRRIVLTGTPMQNNLREYYCMVNFVKPNLLGTYSEYSNRFENPIMNGQHRDSQTDDIKLMKTRTHILHKVLEGCLQRQEVSVLYPYLPKKHEYTVFVSLTKCQSEMYRHYLDEYCNNNKHSLWKDYNMLQKVWSHPRVLHHFQMRKRDERFKEERLEDDLAREDLSVDDIKPEAAWWLGHLGASSGGGSVLDVLETSNKFVAVFKILKECVELNDKLLIFSTSLFTMDALEHFLKTINKWSLGQEYYRLDGSVPPEVRQKWCREFNAEHNHKTKLFLISTRAGSLGLNMTAANRVIILDTSWNPAHDVQSIFRVYRFGQKKDCYIYRLVAMGTMEQKIYERAVTKQAVSCRVVDEQQIDRHYNSAELTELYSFDTSGSTIAMGVAASVRDVALLRVARSARGLHAVHEHDSLLRDTREQLPEHERDEAWKLFQEEQATKQRQNQLTYPKPVYPKLVSKRPHGHDYSRQPEEQALPVKSEPAQPDPEYTPNQSKAKKGRKSSTITCNIPIQHSDPTPEVPTVPEPPIVPEPSDQGTLLNKIRDALNKHNFNDIDADINPVEFAKLVSSIVSNVDINIDIVTPEAYKKIEDVNQSQGDKEAEEPRKVGRPRKQVLEVRDENGVKRQRGRPRKSSTDHLLPTQASDTSPATLHDSLDSEGRGKRKAALFAKKYTDDDVINLDDDDENIEEKTRDKDSDVDYMPDADDNTMDDDIVEEITSELPESIQSTSKIDNSIKVQAKPIHSETKTSDKKTAIVNSIELSDDEEEKAVIPLHTSLLSNKNFIKIVAHTYLKGNPMLDEDAAMLAAEYSTNKALKEVESTGKRIESGPIYDIAVQVLGVDVLKKLHAADPNSKIKTITDEPAPNPKPVSKLSVVKTSTLLKKVEPKIEEKERPPGSIRILRINPKSSKRVINVDVPVLNSPIVVKKAKTSVVPVGLIKRTANISAEQYPQMVEECILPDDDDVHIVSDPAPPPAPAPAPAPALPPPAPAPPVIVPAPATAPLVQILAKKRQSKQETPSNSLGRLKSVPLTDIPKNARIFQIVKTSTPPTLIAPTASMSVQAPLQPIANRSVNQPQVTQIANMAVNTPLNVPSVPPPEYNTICLDSDEEEPAPAPAIQPLLQTYLPPQQVPPVSQTYSAQPVVPISLHVANPNIQYLTESQVNQSIGYVQDIGNVNVNYAQDPASQVIVPNVVRKMISLQQHQSNRITSSYKDENAPYPLLTRSNILLVPYDSHPTNMVPEAANTNSVPMNTVAPVTQVVPEVQAAPKVQSNATKATTSEVRKVRGTLITAPKPGDKMKFSNKPPAKAKETIDPKKLPTVAPMPPSEPYYNKPATSSQPNTARSQPTSASSEPSKPAASTSAKRSRNVSISSSSSSDRSRSSSPNDPMSLFRNVVHIQAPHVTQSRPPKKVAKKSTASTAPRPQPKPWEKQVTPTTKSTTKKPPVTQRPTQKSNAAPQKPTQRNDNALRVLGSFDLTDSEKLPSKSNISMKKASSAPTPWAPSSVRTGPPAKPKSASKPATSSTVMPTPSISKSSASTLKSSATVIKPTAMPKSIKESKPSSSTVVGNSKSIILGVGPNKTVTKTGETTSGGSNRVVHITNMQTIPATSKSTTDVKRKPTAALKPPEVKKNRPMRLEDFSLDDIEDIIELE